MSQHLLYNVNFKQLLPKMTWATQAFCRLSHCQVLLVFRKHVLSLLPTEQVFKLYTFHRGRPTKELYALIGAVVLQQFFDLTDEETIEELAFNQQWHFALECFDESDQVISLKTLLMASLKLCNC